MNLLNRFSVVLLSLLCVFTSATLQAQECVPHWNNAIGQPGTSGSVIALATYSEGGSSRLYAGGGFLAAGGIITNYIAEYTNSTWRALAGPSGTGTSGVVSALKILDTPDGPILYAGGVFSVAGGVFVNNVAQWKNNQWEWMIGPSGVGVTATLFPQVNSLGLAGNALYAGGLFRNSGGGTSNNIAKWSDDTWSPLLQGTQAGVDGDVRSIVEYDGSVYVGGNFTTAGGSSAVNYIASWNDHEWNSLIHNSIAGVAGGAVECMVVSDFEGIPALYVAGRFLTAGGLVVNRIARWTSSGWTSLEGPNGIGTNGTVHALAIFDDGSGPALYVGGTFSSAGGVQAHNIAKWDGTYWSSLGNGVNSTVRAFAVDQTSHELIVGGGFTQAGGLTTGYIATWQGCPITPPDCLGDIADDFGFTVNEGGGPDGIVDFGDFVALLGLIGPCDGGTPGCLGDIADDFGFTVADGGGPDGFVDFGDFVALLGLIGPCP